MKKLKQAYSLVELIVVITVMGILLTILVPNMDRYIQRQRFVSAAEGVFDMILEARNNAIAEKQCVDANGVSHQSKYWQFTFDTSSMTTPQLKCAYEGSAEPVVQTFALSDSLNELVNFSEYSETTTSDPDWLTGVVTRTTTVNTYSFYGDPYQVLVDGGDSFKMKQNGGDEVWKVCMYPVRGYPILSSNGNCDCKEEDMNESDYCYQ